MPEPILTLHDVTAGYPGKVILQSVHLEIAEGTFVRIGGPNGSGKTTLLRLMAGLLPPLHGHIVRRRGAVMGYLPQHRRIDREFPLTAGEVVLSGLHSRKGLLRPFTREQRHAAIDMMDEFGIGQLAAQPINSLSGGQWQRTLLARALVGNPDLLLLDEPDTHLDAGSKEFLHTLLRREATRRTIILVSHETTSLTDLPALHTLNLTVGR